MQIQQNKCRINVCPRQVKGNWKTCSAYHKHAEFQLTNHL